jgi:hypothetical protein
MTSELQELAEHWEHIANVLDDGLHVTSVSMRACDFRSRAVELRAALSRQATPTPEMEELVQWMVQHSFATGHGDKFADLLNSLSWQVAELRSILPARVSEEQRDWRGIRWVDTINASNLAQEIAKHFGHDCETKPCREDEAEEDCGMAWVESKLNDFLLGEPLRRPNIAELEQIIEDHPNAGDVWLKPNGEVLISSHVTASGQASETHGRNYHGYCPDCEEPLSTPTDLTERARKWLKANFVYDEGADADEIASLAAEFQAIQREAILLPSGAFTEKVRELVLAPSFCGISGHFKFQQNGSSCLACQRERTIQRERDERAHHADCDCQKCIIEARLENLANRALDIHTNLKSMVAALRGDGE